MKKSNIKELVDISIESVKGLDEPLKTEAFKIILNKLLENDFKIIKTKSEKIHSDEESEVDHTDPLDKLAKVCECSKDDLINIVDFDKENFVLLKKVDGTNLTEKVQNTSLCILTAWIKGKETTWINTQTLSSALDNSGILNERISEKLRRKNKYFTIKGKKKGAKYRLTASGCQKGIEILKSLLQN